MHRIAQDLRFALKTIRRAPAFAAAVVLTMALGIGGGTAVFSVVNSVLLRPLPFADGDRMVRIREAVARPDGSTVLAGVSADNFVELRTRSRLAAGMVAQRFRSMTLTGAGDARRVVVIQVSPGWQRVTGIRPIAGRAFSTEEEAAGPDARVVVISAGLAQRELGGSAAAAIGRPILLDGAPHTVIGVMPAGYAYPYEADAWIPMRARPAPGAGRDLHVLARVRTGQTPEALQQELDGLAPGLRAMSATNRMTAGLLVIPVRSELVGDFADALWGLLIAAAVLLLIGCANVAMLLLARATARGREMAIRAALGASRGRQVRQLLMESVSLAAIGGALGVAFALLAGEVLTALIPEAMRVLVPTVRIDSTLLLVSAVVCPLTGIVFGLAPALVTSRTDVAGLVRTASAISASTPQRILRGLVIADVALSASLLSAGTLLVRDVAGRLTTDDGLDRRNAVAFSVGFAEAVYGPAAPRLRLIADIEGRIAAAPGIEAVGATTILPLESSNVITGVDADGLVSDAPLLVNERLVTPGYFRAAGIRLVRGRELTESDVAGAPRVAVISEALARRLWPSLDPIGRSLRSRRGADSVWVTVVGVVGDVAEPRGANRETWYLPYAQGAAAAGPGFETLRGRFVVRGSAPAAAILAAVRRAVREADPSAPLYELATLETLHARRHAGARLNATVTGAFSAFGFLLAALGVYGVVAYTTSRRRREFGVRLAIGARRADILLDVLRRGLGSVVIGLAVGLIGAFAATRLLRTMLTTSGDGALAAYLVPAALLLVAGTLAAAWPAVRAARLDPVIALRPD